MGTLQGNTRAGGEASDTVKYTRRQLAAASTRQFRCHEIFMALELSLLGGFLVSVLPPLLWLPLQALGFGAGGGDFCLQKRYPSPTPPPAPAVSLHCHTAVSTHADRDGGGSIICVHHSRGEERRPKPSPQPTPPPRPVLIIETGASYYWSLNYK